MRVLSVYVYIKYRYRNMTIVYMTTLWTAKNASYLLQNLTDSDKICYMLSWVNLSYRNVNALHLTYIMSLHYLIKVRIRVFKWTAVGTVYRKTHQNVFVVFFTNWAWFWWGFVNNFLIQFALTWCKRFPPYLNSVSSLHYQVNVAFVVFVVRRDECIPIHLNFEVLYI